MTDVTRRVDAHDLATLLESARVATAAWDDNGRPAAAPVAFSFVDEQYLVGWPPGSAPASGIVSLLIDAGKNYFDLRGVRVRGPLTPADAVAGSSLEWTVVEPERVTAWHYGAMRPR